MRAGTSNCVLVYFWVREGWTGDEVTQGGVPINETLFYIALDLWLDAVDKRARVPLLFSI